MTINIQGRFPNAARHVSLRNIGIRLRILVFVDDIVGAIYALMLSRLLRDFRFLAVVFIL